MQRLSLFLATTMMVLSASSAAWGKPKTLTSPTAKTAPPQAIALAPQELEGRLDGNSEVLKDGSYYRVYTFAGEAGETAVIELISSEFDAYLILLDPEGKKIAEDDDGGEGNNARIVLELPVTGTYRVIVNTYEAEQTGSYRLVLREGGSPLGNQNDTASALEQSPEQILQLLNDVASTLEQSPEQILQLLEAVQLNQKAIQLYEAGKYEEAIRLAEQALQIRQQVFREDRPAIALSLNTLAFLYTSQGRYEQAEPLYRQALEMNKRLLGEDDPSVAITLNNLAALYRLQGRYDEAEPLYRQSLEMRQRLLGEDDPSVATSLNNLAVLYDLQGRYDEAEPLYRQALEMRQRLLGEDHHLVAASLHNLAAFYESQGKYAEAESLFRQALEMNKRLLGEDHPSVANSLGGLAVLYHSQGRYEEAEPLFRQALEMRKRLLGEEHPHVAITLKNLAVFYESQGNTTRAIDFLSQGLAVEEHNLANLIAIGSERQKRDYMNTLSITTHAAISLHLQSAPNNPEAAKLALTTLLRRKGRILEAVTDNLQTLRQNLTPENQKLLDDLNDTRTQLAALIFNPPNIPPEQYRQQVGELKGEANDLEARIARASNEFRVQTQPVTIEAIQKLIPNDTALIEITLLIKGGEEESPLLRGEKRKVPY